MGRILDVLVGRRETLDTEEYSSLNFSESDFEPEKVFRIGTAEINSQSDLYKVEDAVISGQILIIDVSTLGENLTKEEVTKKLTETVDEIDGNISWRSKSKSDLIISPKGVQINKNSIS